MKTRLLILGVISLLTACATNIPEGQEPVGMVERIEEVADGVGAVEQVLICGTWTTKNLIARPVVAALNVIPFFAGAPTPCPDN